ncbi:hypothetical protein [Prochlorococcus sp. MIT 1307]|uniref:hypothetical protein n=1 Tax=Prochlorococcus sp. MIT 1307 TaxID=3096219 RepID=UPI002A75C957|nr:hypothetical protein [Prochlorococcus sp. MIT 1307]
MLNKKKIKKLEVQQKAQRFTTLAITDGSTYWGIQMGGPVTDLAYRTNPSDFLFSSYIRILISSLELKIYL